MKEKVNDEKKTREYQKDSRVFFSYFIAEDYNNSIKRFEISSGHSK